MKIISLKLDNTINCIELSAGTYDLYFVGGYWVKLQKTFQLKILENSSDELILVKEYFLKHRIFNDNRSVRYFHFDIPKQGTYKIFFLKFEDIEIKKSMLRSLRLFQKSIDLSEIKIEIRKK